MSVPTAPAGPGMRWANVADEIAARYWARCDAALDSGSIVPLPTRAEWKACNGMEVWERVRVGGAV